MAPPPDQAGSGSGATPEAAAAGELRRQASCTCACDREEPAAVARHERRLSASTSFPSPAASPARSTSSSSTNYLPASNKLSSESIPFAVPDLSSFSSSSSYESFFHIEASDLAGGGSGDYLDFEPTTRAPPTVQTMVPPGQQQRPEGAGAAYDPKRLPSSIFRTRSTTPADWSATSNESLFSIQLSNSSDLTAFYADMYYDAAGFPHFPPMGGEAALKHSESSVRSGGLCVRHDCARCSGSGGKTRKSVRFAATESVSTTEGKHAVVVSTLEVAMEEEKVPASAKKAPAAGWCELGCCWPSPTTSWWPRCCVCCGCGCQCKWWL
ncbi:hypothetical protein SEVIR_3G114600v4 [Setaria viridis]|uniref:Uncharacterized protein n=2 Tax=Setaria TaxID=4554 RepID=A0A368QDP5_SETIT|nr:hypothetical protein SETIT_3G112200v2 [Setaria italica]TKW25362.1 hypothetical protein SEVIR_3G114600v2 [Setaria viridis]